MAKAFFGVLQEVFLDRTNQTANARDIGATISLAIDDIVQEHRIVHWTRNTDVQNRMKLAIEDYLFELMERENLELSFKEIDRILDSVLDIARVRYA